MKRIEKDQLDTITSVLDPLGIPWSLRRGKHLVVEITGPKGSQYAIPIAGSPRLDGKAQCNFARQKVHNLLRQFGIPVPPDKHHHTPDGPRRRRNNDRTVIRFEAREECRLDRDPWAELEAFRSR